MTAWQYAQLTITRDIRAGDVQTILWRGPGQGLGENFTDSGHSVLELLNRWVPTAGSWLTRRNATNAAMALATGMPTRR